MAGDNEPVRAQGAQPHSRIGKSPKVVARELGDGEGAVLLHLESGAYHGVNQVGLLVWELLDGERTVADIIEAVHARVIDAPPQLEGDVMGFLDRVLERHLVMVVE